MLDNQRFKAIIDEFSSTQYFIFVTQCRKRQFNFSITIKSCQKQGSVHSMPSFFLEILIILVLSKDFIEISIYSPSMHCLYFVIFFLTCSCCKGMKTTNAFSFFFSQQENLDFQLHFIWEQKIKKVMNSRFSMAFSVIAEMTLSGQQPVLVVFFFMSHVLTDNIPQYSKKPQPLSNLDLLLTLRTHGFYTSRTHRNFQHHLFYVLLCFFHYV